MVPNAAAAELAATFRRAFTLHQQGDRQRARALYEEILRSAPRHFDTLHLLGVLCSQEGDPANAVIWIGRALAVDSSSAAAFFNRATALQELKSWTAALSDYDRCVALDPAFAAAYSNRAVVLRALGKPDSALASCEAAIARNPSLAQAHFNRALLEQDAHQWEAALSGYDRAIALEADYPEAWFNRGNALRELGRPEAALESYTQAITHRPGYALAYCNRGNVLAELQRPGAALESYDAALRLEPALAEAHFNRSIALLAQGNYADGWPEYEWRWKNPGSSNFNEQRRFEQPLWLGDAPLAGKTLLLHSEQGLGDTLQFSRYALLAAGLGARVLLEVQAPLVSLLENMPAVAQVLAKGAELPRFDYHCPLMSLPLAFKTTLESVPANIPYLRVDPAKQAHWQAQLEEKHLPRVGLAWRGSAGNANDRHRSAPLAALLAHLPGGFRYVSLHKELDEADQRTLEADGRVLQFTLPQADFHDAAALSQQMDLVLSVDTSLAHLSGALGRPTWVLLSGRPDWRWLWDRSDSPWYPTIALYRQARLGEWIPVFERVAADLTQAFPRDDAGGISHRR
jgi:tetratricopeptide (TPR) repeat protein